jgi:hypothetical protein
MADYVVPYKPRLPKPKVLTRKELIKIIAQKNAMIQYLIDQMGIKNG